MENETKSGWLKNLTLLSVAVRFLSLAEKLLPVVFSTWNDYLRQKNANLQAEVDLLKTKKRIKDRIQSVDMAQDDLKFLEKYIIQHTKEKKQDAE